MKLAIALAFWRYGITALRHYGKKRFKNSRAREQFLKRSKSK